jgi:phage RecT family recombinase
MPKQKEHPITALVKSGEGSLMEALTGAPLTLEKFVVGLKSACGANPALLECVQENPGSVMQRLVEAAQLGLSPAPVLQHFHLIPRKIKGRLTCTSIVGYRGLIDLALRSGNIEDLGAEIVHKDEIDPSKPFFDRLTGDVNHNPDPFREFDEGNYQGAYAWAKLKGRTRLVTLALSASEIRKRKSYAQTDKIWNEWPKEMVIKTVLRALLNSGFIPMGEKLALLGEQEDRQEEEIKQAEAEEATEAPVEPTAAVDPTLFGDTPIDTGPEILIGKTEPTDSKCPAGTMFYNTETMAVSVFTAELTWEAPPDGEMDARYEDAVRILQRQIRVLADEHGVSPDDLHTLGLGKVQKKWDGDLQTLTLVELSKLKTAVAASTTTT